MAVNKISRAEHLLEQCELAVQREGAPLPAPIAVGMAQAYALLALRETLVRDNETLCVAIENAAQVLGDAIDRAAR